MKLTLGQIADWIHAEGDFTTNTEALGYSIDSRTIGAGELFFAVKGDRVDGHDFVEAALANGAVAAVVSRHWLAPDQPYTLDPCKLLWVPESEDCVLRAMQTLARRVRRAWGGRVIGITGSVGKTTTKDAVAQVLSSSFNVLKSTGNLNNHFGLPLQLLRLEPEHEIAVLEMGMNHAGEIAALAKIAEPNWAVVSNVAAVHLEFFPDGIAGIARAKYELVQALPPDGLAFLNVDDVHVAAFAEGLGKRAVFFGFSERAQIQAASVREDGLQGLRFQVHADHEQAAVALALLGSHNIYSALAAIAVGRASGIGLAQCAAALGPMRPGDKRGEVTMWRGATLINDCYNSNPVALDAMVDALLAVPPTHHPAPPVGSGESLRQGRKIVIAGEMLELGNNAEALHTACGERMAERGVDLIVGVRGAAEFLVRGAKTRGADAIFLASPQTAALWMQAELHPGDVVLLKASRGVRLEAALDLIMAPHAAP